MRSALLLSFVLASAVGVRADDCCVDGQSKPWKPYNSGVRWENPAAVTPDRRDPLKLARSSPWDAVWKSSLERAKKERKLVLLFQLVGDLDLEGC